MPRSGHGLPRVRGRDASCEIGCNTHVAVFRKPFSVERIGVRAKIGCSCHAAHARSKPLWMCHVEELVWLLLFKVRIACMLHVSAIQEIPLQHVVTVSLYYYCHYKIGIITRIWSGLVTVSIASDIRSQRNILFQAWLRMLPAVPIDLPS